ncbi:hypothetical protein J8I87_38015 [Paraburkholderia sp. LEh10]|uniref:hypothetical protein n=1 Tax=Paraburkholderia sp. LEh10 TaxID=2821353 RepID=UPI001AE6CA19|nr:hypothetical protein [Paraburkholderia sp. LEh10]
MPYIESLGAQWGTLCATHELACRWADRLLPIVTEVLGSGGHGYFVGTVPCLSALYAAGRYRDVIDLVDSDRLGLWWYRRWAVDALVSLGRPSDALRLAEASQGLNAPGGEIAKACEAILLSCGMNDEAYRRYAIAANRAGTHLATFRAIARKYPERPPERILADLVESEPGAEGKWFAAAKDAGLFDVALSLPTRSPTDPRTLTRAARDFADKQPHFAMACALAALNWMEVGYGYEITGLDVLHAWEALVGAAAATSSVSLAEVTRNVRQIIRGDNSFIGKVLVTQLAS